MLLPQALLAPSFGRVGAPIRYLTHRYFNDWPPLILVSRRVHIHTLAIITKIRGLKSILQITG